MLLGFAHQITLGSDFVGDTAGRWWWVSLYLSVLALVLGDRVGGLVRAVARRPLRVVEVRPEGAGVSSILVAGPGLRGDARVGRSVLPAALRHP